MFGYVKPVHSELLVKEHEFYKAAYCGVCRSMKKHTGALSNITLSYDSVLLALVRMLYVPDEDIKAKKQRCVAHPLKKRAMLLENPAIEYTARAFAILSYYKALDDWKDEGGVKRALLLPVRPILSRGAKLSDRPELEEIIRGGLEKIDALERAKEGSIDDSADAFGEILGEVFAFGLFGADRTICYQFGFHLGRFILAADAAEDYDEDVREGKYNPYVKFYEGKPLNDENRATIKRALILECKKMESAVNLMPFGNRRTIENIVKNIIYLGLVKRIDFLDSSDKSEKDDIDDRKEGL